jgi:hypothetical protein
MGIKFINYRRHNRIFFLILQLILQTFDCLSRCFFVLRISVTSLKSGEEIASYSVTDIKGISDSYEVGMDSLKQNVISKPFNQLQK